MRAWATRFPRSPRDAADVRPGVDLFAAPEYTPCHPATFGRRILMNMNMLRIALPLVLVGHVAAAKEPAKAPDQAAAPAKAEKSLPAFEKMKTLLGTWPGKPH